jgi:hypothetical protein
MTTHYVPVSDEEAIGNISLGVHTGLRKGTEDPADLWGAISRDESSAWHDAVVYCVDGLASMGYKLCKETKGDD